ncbi:MAG: tetratricopeptide repeat-containing sensor histidine kinase, partial [bacterium]
QTSGIKLLALLVLFNGLIFPQDFIQQRIKNLDSQINSLPKEEKIDSILIVVGLSSYDLPYIGLKWGKEGLNIIGNNKKYNNKKAYLLNGVGKIYNQLDEYKIAAGYYAKALSLMETNSDKFGMAIVYYNIAYNAISLRDFQISGDYFLKSLSLAIESKNLKAQADAYSSIGILNYILGNLDKAIIKAKKGLEISQKINYKEGIALAHEHLGLTYLSIPDYPKTKYHLAKALETQLITGDKFGIAEAAESFSVYYIYLNENQNALALLNQALAITKKNNLKNNIASIYTNMGTLYENLNDFRTALKYFLSSVATLKQLQDYRGLYYTYRRMSFTYEKMGDYKKALESYRLFKDTYDSVYTKIKAQTMEGLESKVDAAKKSYEIKKLEVENNLNSRTSIFLLVSLILAVLVTIISLILFVQKRKTNFILSNINKEMENNQKNLQDLNIELNEVSGQKDKFINILAHDLRSPFFGILGISTILADDCNKMEKTEIKNYLFILNGSLRNIFELLENLLNWSRFNSGKLNFNPIEVNTIDVFEKILELFKFNFQEKSITLEYNNCHNCKILVDLNMFETILRNLISNAIKYSKINGKISINLVRNTNGFVQIEIIDNGIGIDQDSLEKILKNHSISTRGTKDERGTGLGLELCKEFIEINGGHISINSVVNKGTTVLLTIPGIN